MRQQGTGPARAKTRTREYAIRDFVCGAWAFAIVVSGVAFVSCTDNCRQIDPDPTAFSWPSSIVADPAGDYVYVVSTNFDSRYTGGTVIPVRVHGDGPDGAPQIIPEGAVEIGAFAGQPVVSMLSDGRARIWVPVRHGNRLEFADINRDENNVPSLYCRKESGDGDESSQDEGGFHRCEGDYSISLKQYDFVDEDGNTYFASDTYGVAAGLPVTLRDGSIVRPIYVTGIVGSAVVVFTMDESGALTWRDTAIITEGAHSVMEFPIDELHRVIWVSNRNLNQIDRLNVDFDLSGGAVIGPLATSSADLLASTGEFFRGMRTSALSPRLFLAFRSPSSVVVFDIVRDGSLRYHGLLALSGAPSCIDSWVDPEGKERLYVTESSRDFVYVIDAASMTVIDWVYVGAAPAGIAIAGDRAFVAEFEDSAVSWFDLDPVSPAYHTATVIQNED